MSENFESFRINFWLDSRDSQDNKLKDLFQNDKLLSVAREFLEWHRRTRAELWESDSFHNGLSQAFRASESQFRSILSKHGIKIDEEK